MAGSNPDLRRPVSRTVFLKDVLICSLGAYGGPEAHMGVFLDHMVVKRRYLQEDELIELIALCSVLPGPTSTQTIVSIGHRMGGPLLAMLTMLVWALPVLVMMTALSFLNTLLASFDISADGLRFIGPMAVGFIAMAAFRIGKKVVTDRLTLFLLLLSGVTTYFLRTPWIFPLVLLVGGGISLALSKEQDIWSRPTVKPPWQYLVLFAVFALGSLALASATGNQLLHLFESFYRYGYLVFGGGQVVVPVMYSELVSGSQYMTQQEFLTGYGLVQGLPGPMFSFAAYAGGMAARTGNTLHQVAGAIAGGVGIFLPGLLLIFFVYPVWDEIRKIRAIRIALRGINAVAGGMIAVAGVILLQATGFELQYLLMTGVTLLILATRKIPAPVVVVIALAAGFLL